MFEISCPLWDWCEKGWMPCLVRPEQTRNKNSEQFKFIEKSFWVWSLFISNISYASHVLQIYPSYFRNYHMAILLRMIIWIFIFHQSTFCIIMHFMSNNMANHKHFQASIFQSVHGLNHNIICALGIVCGCVRLF